MNDRTYWIHWDNAIAIANRFALRTGIRYRVKRGFDEDGWRCWVVAPVGS